MKTFLLLSVIVGTAGWHTSAAAGQSPVPGEKPGVPGTPLAVTVAPGGDPKKSARAGVAVYGASARTASSDAIPPLVIQFSSTNQGIVQQWEEDLSVMTHIIEQALQRSGDDGGHKALGGLNLLLTASRSVRPLYLEGFGALFMIKVNFPVLPPSQAEDEKTDGPDTEWSRAREELYGRQEPWLGPATSEPGADYQPEQVDALKEELIDSLKNASNIRNLKPDEYVSITVFGAPTGGGKVVKAKSRKKNDAKTDPVDATAKEIERTIREQITPSRTARPGTVLTMRVKKSDVDAFYNNKLTLDGFQKKIVMNSYLGNGYGITSLNSWIRTAIQEPLFKALR